MPTSIRILTSYLAAVVLFLVFTGGYIFELPKAKIDLANVGPWAASLLILCFWAYKKSKLKNINLSFTRKQALIFLGTMCLLIFIGHTLKHWSLHTHGFDVSYAHQALFYPWDGVTPLRADVSAAKTVLGDHLTFSFFALAPLTMFIHSDVWIFFLQVVLVGVALWALVFHGPLKKYPQFFLIVFAIILAHRGLRSGMYFDFREDVLAFVGLCGMILGLLKKNIWIYFLCFALALLSKENVFAVTLFFVFPILFSKHLPFTLREKRILAVITAGISLFYGFAAFKFLIPHYTVAKQGGHPIFARFGFAGHSAPEIVWSILTTPAIWWKLFATSFHPEKLKYLANIILPFAFFYRSRETWVWFLIAVPGILMNICHDYTTQIMMVFHYELILLPGLIAALLFGIQELLKKPSKVSPLFWGLLIALCFSGKWPGYFITSNIPTAAEWAAHKKLKSLPANEVAAVDLRLSAQVNHLKHFENLQIEERDAQNWEAFLNKNQNVQTWILDPAEKLENALGMYLKTRGYKQDATLEGGPVWVLSRTSVN